jgi:predicted polyphosphate/ATP-dependent NAD kinase
MFILGLLSGVVFLFVLLAAVYIGYRLGHKKVKPPDVDEEQKRKAEQLKKHFSNLMSYNVETALQPKKVTK